ncbi:MAG: YIP1 family protein [Peptostreptococcaceae bacterium]|nr:YIP1 family protein [Peptostreptococcaceae bacterium]
MERGNMTLLDDLRYLFTAPSELFYDLDEEPRILRPFFISLLIYIINIGIAYFLGGLIAVPEETLSIEVQFIILIVLCAFVGPLLVLLVNAAQALAYFIGVKVLSYNMPYKTMLSISMYSFIILNLNKTLETVVNSIIGKSDFFTLSPALFFANTAYSNSIISILLKLINPFIIWYVILIVIGIHVISGMSKAKAAGVVLIGSFCLLCIAVTGFIIIGAFFALVVSVLGGYRA